MGCLACGRDLHQECIKSPCCCTQDKPIETSRNYKADDEIGVSAGRKRAAVQHKFGIADKDRPCEWRWKKNCGGGKHPIIGCLMGMQEHRHHGPIKNTSRNETKNVHLICTPCHNRWHTLNDPDYNESANETLPHNPVPATIEECSQNEIKWKTGGYK